MERKKKTLLPLAENLVKESLGAKDKVLAEKKVTYNGNGIVTILEGNTRYRVQLEVGDNLSNLLSVK